jgi:hypothetical protein
MMHLKLLDKKYVVTVLSLFQVANKDRREGATASNVDVSQSSNYSVYCSYRPVPFDIPVILAECDIKDAMKHFMDIIGQETKETGVFITISCQEIDVLKISKPSLRLYYGIFSAALMVSRLHVSHHKLPKL